MNRLHPPGTYVDPSDDGGLALRAGLWAPSGITVNKMGDVFFSDTQNNVVRVVMRGLKAGWQTIITLAGIPQSAGECT